MGLFTRDPAARLKKVFKDYELPTFPGVVTAVLAAIRDPDSSAADIARTMAADPGLSVKVLRLANSATFSPVRRVDNLSQAIALVGMSQVELLVLNLGVRARMPGRSLPGYRPAEFWRLAAWRAGLAFNFAHLLDPAGECAAFTAAYLQDLAVPLLLENRTQEYAGVWEEFGAKTAELVEQERRYFKWDHASVACWLAEFWKLPERIARDIGGHHGGHGADQPPASAAVRLAALLTTSNLEDHRDLLVAAAREECGLPEDVTCELLDRTAEHSSELAALLG